MSASILIVEDENDLSGIIADFVTAAGYEARVMADGAQALASLRNEMPDLLVLDIQLPGLDGIGVCRAVREFSDLPIIMLTSRVQEIDRLLGLEVGADDYVCKPFSPKELVARIKAILRRVHGARPELAATGAQVLEIDDAACAIRINDRRLELTISEFRLLAAMSRRPGVVFSRAQLLDIALPDNLDSTDRAIDTHIKNLRRKLADALPDTDVIHSVYGLGYRFED